MNSTPEADTHRRWAYAAAIRPMGGAVSDGLSRVRLSRENFKRRAAGKSLDCLTTVGVSGSGSGRISRRSILLGLRAIPRRLW